MLAKQLTSLSTPAVRLELTTTRLTVRCLPTELCRNNSTDIIIYYLLIPVSYLKICLEIFSSRIHFSVTNLEVLTAYFC